MSVQKSQHAWSILFDTMKLIVFIVMCGFGILVMQQNSEAQTTGYVSVDSCGVVPNQSDRATAISNTDRINECLASNSSVEFLPNNSYWIDGRGLILNSGNAVLGHGVSSPVYLRHLGYDSSTNKYGDADGFVNRDANSPLNNVKLTNLYLDGRSPQLTPSNVHCPNNTVPGVTPAEYRYGQNCRVGFGVYVRTNANLPSSNITVEGTTIKDWPGVSLRMHNINVLRIVNNRSDNPNKGGFVLASHINDVLVAENESISSGDDAIALNGGDNINAGNTITNFIVRDNTRVSTRPSGNGVNGTADHGAGIVLRAAIGPSDTNPDVFRNTVNRSVNGGIVLAEQDGIRPKRIFVRNNEVSTPARSGIEVESDCGSETGPQCTTGIVINSNTIGAVGTPSQAIAFRKKPGGPANIYWNGSEIIGNTLSGKGVYIEEGIKNVTVGNNP